MVLISTSRRKVLETLFWALLSEINAREIGASRRRRTSPWRAETEVEEESTGGMKKERAPYITYSRTSGFKNDYFYKIIIPDAGDEYVTGLRGDGKAAFSYTRSTFKEFNDAVSCLEQAKGRPSHNHNEFACAAYNFCIEFFSKVRPWRSMAPPAYSKDVFNQVLNGLLADLFEPRLRLRVVVPILNLKIEGRSIPVGDLVLRRLEDFEGDLGYDEGSSDGHAEVENVTTMEWPSSAVETSLVIEHNQVDDPPVPASLISEITNLCDALSLYRIGVPESTDMFLLMPMYRYNSHISRDMPTEPKAYPPLVVAKNEGSRVAHFVKTMRSPAKHVTKIPEVALAREWYRRSLNEDNINSKVIDIAVGFEVLFGHHIGGRDSAQWLALRAARLASAFGSSSASVQTSKNDILQLYAARNAIVHSGKLKPGQVQSLVNPLARSQFCLNRSIGRLLLMIDAGASLGSVVDHLDAAIETPNISPSSWGPSNIQGAEVLAGSLLSARDHSETLNRIGAAAST